VVNPNNNPNFNPNTIDNIDLPSIERKLASNEYEISYEFAADVRLALSNSFRYYTEGNDLYNKGVEIGLLFEKLMQGNEDLVLSDRSTAITNLNKKIEKL